MGKNKKKTFLYVIGFLTHFLFLCYLHPLTLQAQTKKEEIDITALSKQIEQLGEEKYPDFSSIFEKILSMQFTEVFQQIGGWFIDIAFREVFSSKILITELIGVILFSAVFSNISSSFQPYGVSDSGFFVTYLITFSIIFTNFTAMTTLFENTVILLSSFLKVLLPVYTLAVSLSGNLSTGVVFYEYFIIVVLFLNWICIKIFLPLLQYYLLLELLNRFSKKQNISRLCEGLFLFLSKGVQVLFFLFLLLPLTKLLCYVFFYFLLSVVLEPIADERFVECISATVKCGLLLIKVLCMSSVLFIVIIALTTLTTNHIG